MIPWFYDFILVKYTEQTAFLNITGFSVRKMGFLVLCKSEEVSDQQSQSEHIGWALIVSFHQSPKAIFWQHLLVLKVGPAKSLY